jgi:type VI secretion system secreted protein Hcp
MGEMFLKLAGIEGESLDAASPVAHKNEIEIKGWNWTTECTVKWDTNQGGQSTHIEIKHITIRKICDKASVNLYRCCVTGKHIPSGTITCRKNDGDQKIEYLIVDLKDIIVKKVDFDGSGEETSLSETVELSFAEYKMHYKLQEDLGAPGGGTDFGYNIQTMKAV